MDDIEDQVRADPDGARRARRAAAGSFIGAVVEWYDFLLYGIVAALVFGEIFFPGYSDRAGTLAAFATFGVGFIFRPLGGIIFGHFGDRLGRKSMLIWTMTIMGVATALIGCLPTYQTVGWVAPALLVLLRCIQGVAVGGEWGGAALMAVESAPPKLRAFYSSGVQVGYSVGLLLATGLVAILSGGLTSESFLAWGWRIPFLASAGLVLIGLWIRSGVAESEEYVERVKNADEDKVPKLPILEAFRRFPAQIAQIVGLRFIELLTMYIVTTFALSYATDELGIDRQFMLNITLLVGGLGIITIPAFAYLLRPVRAPARLPHRRNRRPAQCDPVLSRPRIGKHSHHRDLRSAAGQHRPRRGRQRPTAPVRRNVQPRVPLQRRRCRLPAGQRTGRRLHAVHRHLPRRSR